MSQQLSASASTFEHQLGYKVLHHKCDEARQLGALVTTQGRGQLTSTVTVTRDGETLFTAVRIRPSSWLGTFNPKFYVQ